MTSTVFFKNQRALEPAALDVLFREARSANGFLPDRIPLDLLRDIVNTTKMAPTALNALPLRVVFVTTDEGRQRLIPTLAPGNVAKVESAPVTAILARDLAFHDHLPRLAPQAPPAHFEMAKANAESMSLFNATMQAGYFILATRAQGLDAGPMGGFSNEAVDSEFFPGGTRKSVLLVTLGYADDSKTFPRNPRLEFEEIASFA